MAYNNNSDSGVQTQCMFSKKINKPTQVVLHEFQVGSCCLKASMHVRTLNDQGIFNRKRSATGLREFDQGPSVYVFCCSSNSPCSHETDGAIMLEYSHQNPALLQRLNIGFSKECGLLFCHDDISICEGLSHATLFKLVEENR